MPKAKHASEPVTGSETEEKVCATENSQEADKKEVKQAGQELVDQQRKLVAEIGSIHDDLRAATRLTAAKAIELGERLTKLKKGVSHGNWLPFVAQYLPFDERTAARYMKVYRSRIALSEKFDSVSNIQVSEAYEVLTRSKTSGPNQQPQEQVDDPATDSQGEHRTADILTEIQRSVADHLEDLPAELLTEFENDFREFLEDWVVAHQQEVQQ